MKLKTKNVSAAFALMFRINSAVTFWAAHPPILSIRYGWGNAINLTINQMFFELNFV